MIDLITPDHPADLRRVAQDLREREQTTVDALLGIMPFSWWDTLFYGLPGLAGLSVGQRLGVSGQDLFFPLDNNAPLVGLLGPGGTMFADFAKVMTEYLKTHGSTAGVVGAAVAPIALGGLRENPFMAMAYALAGGVVASRLFGRERLADFLTDSDVGRRFLQRNMPVLIRNAQNSASIFFDNGKLRDVNGRPTIIPVENRLREGLGTLLGFQTIRRDEESATISLAKALRDELTINRQVLVNRAAEAYEKGDYETYFKTFLEAEERGIDLPQESIRRELLARTQSRLSTFLKHISPEVREEVTEGTLQPLP
jgi:hypothetical protein